MLCYYKTVYVSYISCFILASLCPFAAPNQAVYKTLNPENYFNNKVNIANPKEFFPHQVPLSRTSQHQPFQ